MKWWVTASKEVPLHQQLETQTVLAILAGDLKPGEKLPSTRSLARRLAIHPNTVSSVYRKLQQGGWLLSQQGSGMYVRDRSKDASPPESLLDSHLSAFLFDMQNLGFPIADVYARLRLRCSGSLDHFLLVEDSDQVAEILLAELRLLTAIPLRRASAEECRRDRGLLLGAVPLCRPTVKAVAQQAVGADRDVVVLPINSATASLAPLAGSARDRLIGVASHWSEFLDTAQTMLVAAGVSPDALVILLASKGQPSRELTGLDAILCDTFTASTLKVPAESVLFVFPLLAASAKVIVHAAELATMSKQSLVAVAKVP